MKYCKKCFRIFDDKLDQCEYCDNHLSSDLSKDDTVFLIKAFGFELERIKFALKDNKLPFMERFEKKERSSEAITGKNEAIMNIYVTYGTFNQAQDLLRGIGAIKTEEEIENTEEPEEMSKPKRTAVKVISAVIFFILIALLVYGVDFITEAIMRLM